MNVRLWLLIASIAAVHPAVGAGISVREPRCEEQSNPLGIDSDTPALSWKIIMEPGAGQPRRGVRQHAYQILVASTPELLSRDQGDLWDSGKVDSDRQTFILYAGKPLQSQWRCHWKVRVWTAADPTGWSEPAFWTMGLLKPNDWKGRWISASKWFVPANAGRRGYSFRTKSNPDSPAWVVIDLGSAMPVERVRLHPQPGQLDAFPLRFRIEGSDEIDFDHPLLIADRSGADVLLEKQEPLDLAGDGVRARFVRLLILRSPAIASRPSPPFAAPAKPQPPIYESALRQIEIWSGGRNAALMRPTLGNILTTSLVDGLPMTGGSGVCPADACPAGQAPLLRKDFRLEKPVRRAVVSYAAHGMAEMSVNGGKVDDTLLGPPFTDYTKRIVYRTCDVTGLLVPGENVLGALLGNGFFSPPGQGFGWRHNGHGQPRLLAQLDIEFTDGTRRTVATDTTWKWARSEITQNDVWSGYTEDRRLIQPGWDRPGFFPGSGWQDAGEIEPLGGVLRSPMGPPARLTGQLKPTSVQGDTVFFDVYGSGWARLSLRNGKAGQTIVLTGNGMVPCRYTLGADGPAVLEPRLVWGSSPIKLTVAGLNEPLTPESVRIQLVRADLRPAGSFECSNPYLNNLHDAVLRTHLNYILDQPMDPMREKQGWTQDAQNMFETAACLTDVSRLYRKWWRDFADNQLSNGLTGSVAPVVARYVPDWNCPMWSGVIVWLPWQHYLYYGDRRVLEDAYEPMRRYVDFLDRLASAGGGARQMEYPDLHDYLNPGAAKEHLLIWVGAGDWMNPSPYLPGPLLSMACWHQYADIVSRTAALLGKNGDAARYAEMADRVRKTANARFLNPQTGLYANMPKSQSAQVMPLACGLVPDVIRPLTFQRLIEAVHAMGDHHGGGFVSLPHLLQTLTVSNQSALANRIVNQTDFPSWKTLMHEGVLFEDWKGGNAQMPSCGGAVGMWLYQSVLGIRPDPAGPGFKRFILAPQPDPATGLTWARGSYDSVQGMITSDWKTVPGRFTLHAVIPPNTTATVRVPANDEKSVMESGRPAAGSKGVAFLRKEDGAVLYTVGSGTYEFTSAISDRQENE